MQFTPWQTDYEMYCAEWKREGKTPDTYETFFRNRLDELRRYGGLDFRLKGEHVWDVIGRPYYNIHPKMVSKLCKTKLVNIPSHLFMMPHNYQAVNFRFAEVHPEFQFTEDEQLDLPGMPAIPLKGHHVVGILIVRGTDGSVLCLADYTYKQATGQPTYSVMSFVPQPNLSMQEAIDSARSEHHRNDSYRRVTENVIRLVVTVGFLSNNPTICEADVLSKDRSSFLYANDEQRELIAARARRRGKVGYNIGTDLMFLGARPMGERHAYAPTGRELEYAHIRAGHPHAVRYGHEKQLVKIMWYVPTTVRADRPFKAE
jgi:hypothetical protein